MEASAIPAQVGLARTRLAIGAPLLRLRSDEQLVSLFRDGSDEAFRAIHDRYRQRMFAYTRQMLAGSSADAEDAVQEIFVRAYAGLRISNRDLALRAWLYRVAHNRCVDELRRPQPLVCELIASGLPSSGADPVACTEQRDDLRTLIADVQRLPEQQRSALLMREMGGMTYIEVAGALGVTVQAVKSLLVRARVGLAQASEARNTACAQIRESVMVSHDRGVRASGLARRHMRDCAGCRQFRAEMRGVSRQLAGFAPTLGPLGIAAKLLGLGGAGGGGAAAGGGAIAGSGVSAGGIAGSGATASLGALTGATHVVTILAAAVVTAGGAIELQHIAPQATHHGHRRPRVTQAAATRPAGPVTAAAAAASAVVAASVTPSGGAPVQTASAAPVPSPPPAVVVPRHTAAPPANAELPLTETVDPDNLPYYTSGRRGAYGAASSSGSTTSTSSVSGTSSSSSSTTATGTSSTGSAATSGSGDAPTAAATGGAPTGGSSTSSPAAGGSSDATGSTMPASGTSSSSSDGTSKTAASTGSDSKSTTVSAAMVPAS